MTFFVNIYFLSTLEVKTLYSSFPISSLVENEF